MNVLSHKEKQVLAAIESSLRVEDPALAARLARGRKSLRLEIKRHSMPIGAVTLAAGALLVSTVYAFFWLAVLGVVLMLSGAFLIADPVASLTKSYLRYHRARRSAQKNL